MAILQQPVSNQNPFTEKIGDALAPAGTFIATVLDIKDEFGVTRQKFESSELEKVDLTCFLFGFRDAQGKPHRAASRQMRISGNEKAALFGFLKGLLGHAPAYGWDYCTLKGAKCLLTIEHVQRRDGNGVYASIAALSPLPVGIAGQAAAVLQAPAPVAPPPPASYYQPKAHNSQAPVPAPVVPTPAPQPVPDESVEDDVPF